MAGFVKWRTSKYGNKRMKCNLGHSHGSKDECSYCFKLQLMLENKLIKGFVYEKPFDLYVNGKFITRHKPDFYVETLDGTFYIDEFKGYATAEWDLKRKLFEALFPDVPYNVRTKRDLLF